MAKLRRFSPERLPLLDRLSFAFFLLIMVGLALWGIDRSCLDAADSAYLISSDAIARGMMPYRDFLVAHPPLLFLIGAPLAKLGLGSLPFRIFSILVLALLGLSVRRIAYRVTANTGIAMLAGVLTLFAPLSIYFSKEYINDPLVSLFTVLIFLLLFGKTKKAMAGAGVLSVLATLTKLTWLPVLVLCLLYVIFFRRRQGWLYLVVALGGSLAAAIILQSITGGAYLGDIFGAQASKAYSLTNFLDGLKRIWQIDWPLIVPSVVGIWFAARAIIRRNQLSPGLRGRLFLLTGWLFCGLLLLVTLPLEGHDTNLFLLAEPALAILASWGVIGLVDRGSWPVMALVFAWVAIAVPTLVDRDREFLFRSNAEDVATIVAEVEGRSTDCQPVLVTGCIAVEANRPVTLDYFDQFLWEEKFKRGDDDAVAKFAGLESELAQTTPPVAVFSEGQFTREQLAAVLEENYQLDFASGSWPPLEMWVPRSAKIPG